LKVTIGKYKSWCGPYQIASALCFWAKKTQDEYGTECEPDWVHNFGSWLAGGDKKDSWLYKICLWIDSHKKRKIKVQIDHWDTWSMDSTLSHIILPMLKQLQATKHGAPFVDDEDVPEELCSTNAEPKENDYDVDSNHFKRWDWVLDEMIFAFEHKIDDTWQDKFYSGEWHMNTVEVDHNGKKLHSLQPAENHTYTCDYEAMKVVENRIQNGFRLFGRYFQSLWD
jgi:hypothetical protein